MLISSMTGWVVMIAVLLDLWLGEPARWHPLVGFGKLATALESRLNGSSRPGLSGGLAWLLAVMPFVIGVAWLDAHLRQSSTDVFAVVFAIIVLYWAMGWQSLREHAMAIYEPLWIGDVEVARAELAKIVSRDVDLLDEQGIAAATVESVLENGSDSLFAAVFWFVIAGVPGVVLYRLSNTLDAMWGYKTARFRSFGFVAAKMDDALNWIPARCVAYSYALLGHYVSAMQCWRTQASTCASPNAGPVISAGAGALQMSVGGPVSYHGVYQQKPKLGVGPNAQPKDIVRSINLISRALFLWCAVLLLVEIL